MEFVCSRSDHDPKDPTAHERLSRTTPGPERLHSAFHGPHGQHSARTLVFQQTVIQWFQQYSFSSKTDQRLCHHLKNHSESSKLSSINWKRATCRSKNRSGSLR